MVTSEDLTVDELKKATNASAKEDVKAPYLIILETSKVKPMMTPSNTLVSFPHLYLYFAGVNVTNLKAVRSLTVYDDSLRQFIYWEKLKPLSQRHERRVVNIHMEITLRTRPNSAYENNTLDE